MVKREYTHHMIREIHEEPEAIRRSVVIGEKELQRIAGTLEAKGYQRIYLTGCGSSYFTGITGKYALEEFAQIPSSATPALEFVNYASSLVDTDSLVLCISQSGETIETLKAMAIAKRKGACVLGLTNNQQSTLGREADMTISTDAGIEIGPGTKTVVTQMAKVYQFALNLALARKSYPADKTMSMLSSLRKKLPTAFAQVLEASNRRLRALADKYKNAKDIYVIGSGPCFICALQASNLFKETSSIHAEAFSVEEFRHGPLEALDRNSVFLAINPHSRGHDSLLKLMKRAKETGANILSMGEDRDTETRNLSDDFLSMPKDHDEWQASFLYLLPLQLFAYYIALKRKIDPDHFRNIHKTWTVE